LFDRVPSGATSDITRNGANPTGEICNPELETRLARRSLGEAGNAEPDLLAHETHETREIQKLPANGRE
jgi:hypothetical protein